MFPYTSPVLTPSFFRWLVKKILATEKGAYWENSQFTSDVEFEALQNSPYIGTLQGMPGQIKDFDTYDPTIECMYFLFIAEMLESEEK